MKPIENAWNGLVQRKLLPLAILLLAAIVAVPFLLSKDPEPLPAAPASPAAAAGSKSEDTIAKPVVSITDENAPAERRRVLGYDKNPFKPAPAPKPTKAEQEAAQAAAGGTAGATATGTTTTGTTGVAVTGGNVAGAGATSGTTTAPAASPVATATPAPVATKPVKREYKVYSAVVRFGATDAASPEQSTITRRMTTLPDNDAPALIYFGFGPDGKGGKAAYFYVANNAELDDETQCRPSVRDCQGIILSVGDKAKVNTLDTATGEVTGTYEIELVKIKTKIYDNAEDAKNAVGKASKAGRSALSARASAYGPLRYRYETRSGLVRKLGKRTYRALQAASASVALATAGGF